ncbi:MAG: cysteine synthase family protein [Candidatus Zixiibacteriota bacterium]|nr:MAG: cysteine synthase family protein [candidate division Zixibacteria bacterium]
MRKTKTSINTNELRPVDSFYLDNITESIGNTPLVRLRSMTAERGVRAKVLVKPEFLNPTGSVKDRMAVYILKQAVARGELKPGGTIVEGTSGNTGAAVAMFAAAHGFKAIFTIPDKMSTEKVDTLRAFGAEVHVCPTAVPADSPESYYETAKRIHRETPGSYYVGQYFNLDNIEAHYRITGPEIWRQTGGKFDVFVGGIGTGGTVSGTARFLKEQNPAIEVVAADPLGSVYYQYHRDGTLIEPQTYLVEGIGEDMLCPTIDFSVIDKIYQVNDKQCFETARELTRKEGIFGGGSSGAAVHVALEHARGLGPDKTMIVLLPDWGGKYISKMFSDEWMRDQGLLEQE